MSCTAAVNLFLVLFFMSAAPALAQRPAGPAARIVTLKPKEGMQRQFEEGYKRHLNWHKENKDPWTWYGWQVISGDRLGYFVDGSFGHRWEDFDSPVSPAADSADNLLNVAPYADFLSVSHYIFLPEASRGGLLEAARPSALIEWTFYQLNPGKELDFERVLKRINEASAEAGASYSWYRLVSGGEQPAYLLMLPLSGFADFAKQERPLWSWLSQAVPEKEAAELAAVLRSAIRSTRSETLRYRADLSYFPQNNR